jgi:hypothetical protein
MKNNFHEYVGIQDALEKYKAFCLEDYFPWAKDYKLPDMDVDLPCIKKKAKIQTLILNKNPIFMKLSDGSQLYFTHDEFKRIKGTPENGKTMSYELIRLANDKSNIPSKIKNCYII